ncbi:glycoside hydrolase family 25 protein [Croceibacterium sp. TMG7-5b_MA50]|uniref:glycoside hydrolase family 25 protein n=1 Tax=Croceibacterium sp. TMG7-5b_MA50 TaxID=3121290 RepID=UPI00322214BB
MGRQRTWWQARRWRVALGVVLASLPVTAWGWWQAAHWAPDAAAFPVQGVVLGAADGAVDMRVLAATGARFAYLEASRGAGARDPLFARNLALGQAAGLRIGAIHRYDPCVPADMQAASFVTTVPRLPAMLPPAVALVKTAEGCADPLAATGLEGELTTFLNQIEHHTGSRALLAIDPAFAAQHPQAADLGRKLWVTSDWWQPDQPWTLWTANAAYRSEASDAPLRWVVAQP